jgi:MoaA/NifB/PqqE/SkfB family radical SAM enzyme
MISATKKKFRLLRTWASRHPLWCAWQVTYRCNFRCRFCHYWCDPMGLRSEPAPAEFAEGARRLAGFGTLLVSLAGGEPMLREDLPEVVRAVGRFHFPFVTTNGWFVTPDSARALMESGVWGVSVSIDYDDPARHDASRGAPGAWRQAWRAVELLSAARVHEHQRINVMCVLLEDNLDEIEALLRRAAAHRAYLMVQPYGFRKTGSRGHDCRSETPGQRLLELKRRYPNFLSNGYYLRQFDRFLAGGVPGCRAGRAFFNIDSTGDVAVCVERRGRPVGNLFSQSASQLRRRLIEGSRDNRCRDCWYNCRGEVESLYHPAGLARSLPTLLLDRGAAR